MAQTIATTNVRREPGFLYYVKQGNIWSSPMKKPGATSTKGKARKICIHGRRARLLALPVLRGHEQERLSHGRSRRARDHGRSRRARESVIRLDPPSAMTIESTESSIARARLEAEDKMSMYGSLDRWPTLALTVEQFATCICGHSRTRSHRLAGTDRGACQVKDCGCNLFTAASVHKISARR